MYVINPVKLKYLTNNLYQFYVHDLIFNIVQEVIWM